MNKLKKEEVHNHCQCEGRYTHSGIASAAQCCYQMRICSSKKPYNPEKSRVELKKILADYLYPKKPTKEKIEELDEDTYGPLAGYKMIRTLNQVIKVVNKLINERIICKLAGHKKIYTNLGGYWCIRCGKILQRVWAKD